MLHALLGIPAFQALTMTKSTHTAVADLKLNRLFVVYPGTEVYDLNEKTVVVPLEHLSEHMLGAAPEEEGEHHERQS
jgi:hypothetical protein